MPLAAYLKAPDTKSLGSCTANWPPCLRIASIKASCSASVSTSSSLGDPCSPGHIRFVMCAASLLPTTPNPTLLSPFLILSEVLVASLLSFLLSRFACVNSSPWRTPAPAPAAPRSHASNRLVSLLARLKLCSRIFLVLRMAAIMHLTSTSDGGALASFMCRCLRA